MTTAMIVDFTESATFSVSVGGSLWLQSAPIRLFADGVWQTLTRAGVTRYKGADRLGTYACVNVSWTWSEKNPLHTSLKVYAHDNLAVFVQELPHGANGTNASNPTLPGGIRAMDPGDFPPVVAFPAFTGGQLERLGYLLWQSRMVNAEWGTNVTSGLHGTNEPLGSEWDLSARWQMQLTGGSASGNRPRP